MGAPWAVHAGSSSTGRVNQRRSASPYEERSVPTPLIPSPDMSAARRPRRRALAAAALLIGLLGLAA